MAPEDPELLEEWNKMQQELKDLEWAQQSYAKRQQEKEQRKLKKEYREKRKQYNDPYEIDPYKAMKAGRPFERDRYGDNLKPKRGPYLHETNFPIIRELSLDKKLVMKEWLVRSYEVNKGLSGHVCENNDTIILYLEELPLCENKMELEVSWEEAIEILHRRCFNYAK